MNGYLSLNDLAQGILRIQRILRLDYQNNKFLEAAKRRVIFYDYFSFLSFVDHKTETAKKNGWLWAFWENKKKVQGKAKYLVEACRMRLYIILIIDKKISAHKSFSQDD